MPNANTNLVLAIVVAIVVVALLAWIVGRVRRTTRLKQTFGSEYERAVEAAKGSRNEAEAELVARSKRVQMLDIHPLTPRDRDRFADRWRMTQASFVDDPVGAVAQADALVGEVMRARGYPVAEFEKRAADLSVGHPRFVHNYREAHAIALAAQSGTAKTEDLRRATIHYRDLFEDLLQTAA